jgi:hypothetical protein
LPNYEIAEVSVARIARNVEISYLLTQVVVVATAAPHEPRQPLWPPRERKRNEQCRQGKRHHPDNHRDRHMVVVQVREQ